MVRVSLGPPGFTVTAVKPGRWSRDCFPFGVFHERRIWGVSLIDWMKVFCEVADSERFFLFGMCILIRAGLEFGGCAFRRPVAILNL